MFQKYLHQITKTIATILGFKSKETSYKISYSNSSFDIFRNKYKVGDRIHFWCLYGKFKYEHCYGQILAENSDSIFIGIYCPELNLQTEISLSSKNIELDRMKGRMHISQGIQEDYTERYRYKYFFVLNPDKLDKSWFIPRETYSSKNIPLKSFLAEARKFHNKLKDKSRSSRLKWDA